MCLARSLLALAGAVAAAVTSGQDLPLEPDDSNNNVKPAPDDTWELVQAFVMFRHGDRTPDQEEIDLFPSADASTADIFFPYGKKALTNKGKMRGYRVGEYLRQRYDGFVSALYLPGEVAVRTTDYARTKMTALTALAALYPPPPAQRWHPALAWQPVPYDTPPHADDSILYWYNCERYIQLRDRVYQLPEVQQRLVPHRTLLAYLEQHTGTNVTTMEDVFFLDNLFQALENVGVKTPQWALEVMPTIKEITRMEFAVEFYNSELIRYASGPLFEEILNDMKEAISGNKQIARLQLFSAHENNVAALMAAAGVFYPHQPAYGATFSLELWREPSGPTQRYGVMAVYAAQAGGPGRVLPVPGCESTALCDYDTFLNLTRQHAWPYQQFRENCHQLVN